jgi:hypothetical protein
MPREGVSRAPEQRLRALVLQVLYSIRSERLLCEQFEYNLLFRNGKGQLAKLYYIGHVLHRLGLPVDVEFTEADGYAECRVAHRAHVPTKSASASACARATSRTSRALAFVGTLSCATSRAKSLKW